MIQIQPKDLTPQNFSPYGHYADMLGENLKIGEPPVEFHRDIIQHSLGNCTNVSMSICRIWPGESKVAYSEQHSHTAEGLLPIDGDIFIHVAPAHCESTPQIDRFEIFRIPQGTFVTLRPGVWHGAPLAQAPERLEPINVLVSLPGRTYANDCTQFLHDDNETLAIATQNSKVTC